MPFSEFTTLLYGLSASSRYANAVAREPIELHGEAAASYIDTL
ncbi:hypothetical protein [Nonomuraea sp. NPDC050310]